MPPNTRLAEPLEAAPGNDLLSRIFHYGSACYVGDAPLAQQLFDELAALLWFPADGLPPRPQPMGQLQGQRPDGPAFRPTQPLIHTADCGPGSSLDLFDAAQVDAYGRLCASIATAQARRASGASDSSVHAYSGRTTGFAGGTQASVPAGVNRNKDDEVNWLQTRIAALVRAAGLRDERILQLEARLAATDAQPPA